LGDGGGDTAVAVRHRVPGRLRAARLGLGPG